MELGWEEKNTVDKIRLHIMLMHANYSIINCVCMYSMPSTIYAHAHTKHRANYQICGGNTIATLLKRSVDGVAKPLLALICAKTDSTRKMGRTKAARKRRNKEFRARLIKR